MALGSPVVPDEKRIFMASSIPGITVSNLLSSLRKLVQLISPGLSDVSPSFASITMVRGASASITFLYSSIF